ncbi:hypothetical protein IMG5_202840 [Ichthyophthirius multifiliis]|uniref:Uncharacterized protein n=1 Tax=Ichthyophthirius multifiliis TaxID=5932 RepID=G0R682_ICHMU|nr:hypothetical protein IMG5_202840 [Ichthyophthirius multifiliis]EGR27046.1 hypothetical protein IMG5_202840 [Ichthyophthirius multifiliis]|eukprot:XP_004023930.1 hypothetical protein IMG5_202840 [Ichthyophthirius multifiliis]
MYSNIPIKVVYDNTALVTKNLQIEISNQIKSNKYLQLIDLYDLQIQQYRLQETYEQKVKETISKFKTQAKEIFQEQNAIISGSKREKDFTLQEIKNTDLYFDNSNAEENMIKNERFASTNLLPIDDYWFLALTQCELISNQVKINDKIILKSLKQIYYDQPDENQFTLNFEFNNLQELNLQQQIGMKGKIQQEKQLKKQKNRRTGVIRIVTHEIENESFFNYFNTLNFENEKANIDNLQDRLCIDYNISRAIIDEVLPYSLEYYLKVRKLKLQVQHRSIFENEDDDEDQYDQDKINDKIDNNQEFQEEQKKNKNQKGGKKKTTILQNDKKEQIYLKKKNQNYINDNFYDNNNCQQQ